MAKFNIEVELDWMEGEYSIDEELRERVISGVEEALLKRSTQEVMNAVDKSIADKIAQAETVINDTVDAFIKKVCEDKLETVVIPSKKNDWSGVVEYKPLTEFIGDRFNKFLTTNNYDEKGRYTNYSSEKRYSAAEIITKNFLEKTLGVKIEEMIAKAKRDVEESLVKSLEQKLKENLAKETIKQMNIPDVIRRFSEMTLTNDVLE